MSFRSFQMPVFFTFLNTRNWWGAYNQAVARESPDLSACPWLLRLQVWCIEEFLSCYDLTNLMLKWIWCGSAGSCDDFFLRDTRLSRFRSHNC